MGKSLQNFAWKQYTANDLDTFGRWKSGNVFGKRDSRYPRTSSYRRLCCMRYIQGKCLREIKEVCPPIKSFNRTKRLSQRFSTYTSQHTTATRQVLIVLPDFATTYHQYSCLSYFMSSLSSQRFTNITPFLLFSSYNAS